MNSPVGGQYIGAGITLGLTLTFGYLAAMSLARKNQPHEGNRSDFPAFSARKFKPVQAESGAFNCLESRLRARPLAGGHAA
jgi:hypothetical protein